MSDAEVNEPTADLQQTLLMGGANFPTWPDLKWARGSTHVAALQASLVEWHASAPVSVDLVIREDRLGLDFVARVPRGIPKHEWGLLLGDALHNLRSAFDAMAWGMAHFNGAEPSRPKSIYFPICTDEDQWDEAVRKWVGEIAPEFQGRLRMLQPFTFVEPGGFSVLKVLHDLDIQDKHKEMLSVIADMQSIDMRASFQYEYEDAVATPQIDMKTDVVFRDGAVLGTIHAGAPIKTVGRSIIRPAMHVQLTHAGSVFHVGDMLPLFVNETRRYLDILMAGAEPEADREGWSTMPVGSPET